MNNKLIAKKLKNRAVSSLKSALKTIDGNLFEPGRIAKKIETCRLSGHPLRLIIGSGGTNYEGWIATDRNVLDLLKEKTWSRLLSPDSVDAILAEHVWEHLTLEDGIRSAHNCHTYLKKGGSLRIAVPDGFQPNKDYIEYVKPGGTGAGAEDHKILYTWRTLKDMLEKAGFTKIDLLEYFDKEGQFHKQPWTNEKGYISRSTENDGRNAGGRLVYTSLIVDAVK